MVYCLHWLLSSAGEHSLHRGGVKGSNPLATTISSVAGPLDRFCFYLVAFFRLFKVCDFGLWIWKEVMLVMDKKGKGDQNSENPADSKSSGSELGLMLYCKFPKKIRMR